MQVIFLMILNVYGVKMYGKTRIPLMLNNVFVHKVMFSQPFGRMNVKPWRINIGTNFTEEIRRTFTRIGTTCI